MIWESYPWRLELHRIARRLRYWSEDFDHENEELAFEIERDVMVGAYAVRKLLDAEKLPTSLKRRNFRVVSYPIKHRVPDLMNWHRTDEFYDFDKASEKVMPSKEICNQMIHSFVWMTEAGEESPGLTGILFNSDRSRERELYRIGIEDLAELFSAATEEVTMSFRARDVRGQWVVKNYSAAETEATGNTPSDLGLDF